MAKTVGSYEAKTNLSSLLVRVEKGETITITKRGRPVAILSPPGNSNARSLDVTVQQIRKLREGFQLKGLSLKKLISEGRE